MSTITGDSLLQQLNWRYATKKMDPAKSVPQDKVERILEAARLAPTSPARRCWLKSPAPDTNCASSRGQS